MEMPMGSEGIKIPAGWLAEIASKKGRRIEVPSARKPDEGVEVLHAKVGSRGRKITGLDEQLSQIAEKHL